MVTSVNRDATYNMYTRKSIKLRHFALTTKWPLKTRQSNLAAGQGVGQITNWEILTKLSIPLLLLLVDKHTRTHTHRFTQRDYACRRDTFTRVQMPPSSTSKGVCNNNNNGSMSPGVSLDFRTLFEIAWPPDAWANSGGEPSRFVVSNHSRRSRNALSRAPRVPGASFCLLQT